MIFVRDIMTRRVKTIGPEKTLREAARAMARSKIGSIVVVEGKPIGIVTEGDVLRAVGRGLDPSKSRVGALMSRKLVTITPDEKLENAAKLMAEAHVKKLPVMEGGKLIGIVTQTDIVDSSFDLVTSLKEMVRARYRPPDFQP